MKTLLMMALFIGIPFLLKAQTTNPMITSADLMKKSDSQFTGGIIFLSGGSLLVIADALHQSTGPGDGTMSLIGAAMLIIGVPLVVASGNNARLAAKLSLKNQTLNHPSIFPGQPRNIPSLSLKIPL
ncbi:hypothetical protein DFQ04_2349 [Algoriphagus boseongensis]|uniref:Uncharacterized protein n=1 Tax=Algoriphagus boseongensis TaxID=1442587 RepID=A0A4R6T3L0_9BACT|nr:hypothetical protein [Algoriphagus boseongensis]TDQ16237.1 hypothetical protein DFQ04_2349 [Algoriphagus boseongensis]